MVVFALELSQQQYREENDLDVVAMCVWFKMLLLLLLQQMVCKRTFATRIFQNDFRVFCMDKESCLLFHHAKKKKIPAYSRSISKHPMSTSGLLVWGDPTTSLITTRRGGGADNGMGSDRHGGFAHAPRSRAACNTSYPVKEVDKFCGSSPKEVSTVIVAVVVIVVWWWWLLVSVVSLAMRSESVEETFLPPPFCAVLLLAAAAAAMRSPGVKRVDMDGVDMEVP
mmetsp:Transcript_26330/g.61244  ORF Transcript_26330/g.61244 Transcript_26330/m.61244 type:complete len:225 (-) Transcript_26330:403-1077(-)